MPRHPHPRATFLRHLTAAFLLAAAGLQAGCRAEQPWPLWDSYTAKFLDSQGRVIDHTGGADITTTEGEAYAMFFALVANDRSRFDKLVDWTEANLAHGDLTAHLPAWSWGKAPDGSWRVLDEHPAADADLWMAYALSEAGRLWGADRYASLGSLMARHVAHEELVLVPGLGTTVIPGAQGFHPDPSTWFVNASYLPPTILAYFAKHDPGEPWGEALASLPQLTTSRSGWAMDWMLAGPNGVRPTVNPGEVAKGVTANLPPASFDAIRVYLWAGLADPRTASVREILSGLSGMALYLKTHDVPPSIVDSNGRVLNSDSPPGFSAAVIPYLHALGLKDAEKAQDSRLLALRDPHSGLYGKDGLYYDQNLALFSTGWSEHRFRFEADGRLQVKWK